MWDEEVAQLSATSGIDRFAQAQTWTYLSSAESVFDHVRALLRCKIVKRIQAREPKVLIACALKSHFARTLAP